MMHPNHKLVHTKLQLIKRMLSASNAEIIMRFIFSTNDEINQMNSSSNSNLMSFNLKLSFYLNAIINSTGTSLTSDKEILKTYAI